jgi:hypothetical protein
VTVLFRHRGFWPRHIGLLVFLVVVFVYGCFELWRAWKMPSADASNGVMFGVLFVGGSLIGIRQVLADNRDLVVALARNEAEGGLVASVFSRVRTVEITAAPADFTNWRLQRKSIGRSRVVFFVHADCRAWPRPLRFDVRPGSDLAGLRALAPEAIAEFEAATAPAGAAKS